MLRIDSKQCSGYLGWWWWWSDHNCLLVKQQRIPRLFEHFLPAFQAITLIHFLLLNRPKWISILVSPRLSCASYNFPSFVMYVHIYIINDGIIWLPIPSWLEFVNKQMCLEPISKKKIATHFRWRIFLTWVQIPMVVTRKMMQKYCKLCLPY